MDKKRFFSLTMGAFVLVASFVGCSKTPEKPAVSSVLAESAAPSENMSSETDIKGEITFVNHRTDMMGDKWEAYAKRFNEKYPNIKVKFEAMSNYE
jgi:ABC-type glycerol-3-phosphate transport system substrate-binding protein